MQRCSSPSAALVNGRAGGRDRRSAIPRRPAMAASAPGRELLTTDAKRPQQPALPQPPSPASAHTRRSGGSPGPGPGGDPSDPGPGPGQQPEGPGGPGGGGLSFRLRYWILLLTEYGGIYGTAAVVLGALCHVDALGGLHWDQGDVALGLGLMAPVLLFDALVGLPDWSTRGEDEAKAVVSLFVDPKLLAAAKEERQELLAARKRQQAAAGGSAQGKSGRHGDGGSADASETATTTGRPTGSGGGGDALDAAMEAVTAMAASSASGADGSGGAVESGTGGAAHGSPAGAAAATTGGGGGPPPSPESSVRNNPGARLTPLQEAAVIVAGVTAEEMLYRAVLLTLFGRWLRDRAYEAGAEETLTLLAGPGGAGGLAVDTDAAASWAALAVGLVLGAAVFAAKAWQETTMAKRLRAAQAAQREELAKEIRKQRLMGQQRTLEELQTEAELMTVLEAAQAHLASSIGVQGALVWALEGSREVLQVAAAGSSFLLTGNLAAPLAGGLAAQALVSAYQRLGLRRSMQRRAEVVARRRQKQQQEAAEAEAAKAAAPATSAEAATAPGSGSRETEGEGSEGGSRGSE
ncbi:hypothetical protein GPECTOR_81g195 [Gonium pectorale]|uniref:Uncharacterized protein n=1 Tax=Gonium pectorale TaxID=33097 RepID=A0A150G1J8_GONPE|nr:hypothetical protein GPECTOR_81g195 [Gonium pectorale]|eukprot:KXZ43746.1 hypothetical protein GPECTOR_81g195 [Gonium pectorale]